MQEIHKVFLKIYSQYNVAYSSYINPKQIRPAVLSILSKNPEALLEILPLQLSKARSLLRRTRRLDSILSVLKKRGQARKLSWQSKKTLSFFLTVVTIRVTILFMIKSFNHKGLEKFFYEGDKSGIQANHSRKIADILDRLDASISAADMNYPGSNLHRLKGNLKDHWSVKVSGNWRITFEFIDQNAYVVNYQDYH